MPYHGITGDEKLDLTCGSGALLRELSVALSFIGRIKIDRKDRVGDRRCSAIDLGAQYDPDAARCRFQLGTDNV